MIVEMKGSDALNKLKRFISIIMCFAIFIAVAPTAYAETSTQAEAASQTTTQAELTSQTTAQAGSVSTETTQPATTEKETPETPSYDVDRDGEITTDDVRLLLKIAAGQADRVAGSDLNLDGIISIDDVKLLVEQSFTDMTDEEYVQYLLDSGFTKSYTDSLLALHKKYPEWEFTPFITNITWCEAVEGEHTPHNKQLIENVVSADFKCSCKSCKGVIQEASNWVSASEAAVEYYLDPRNFLSEQYIFQFETTAYDVNHTINAVESILKSTWMHNSEITYLDASGATKTYMENGKAIKYSEAIMKAAKDSGMSAYYLASKIVQEVGASVSSYAGGSCGNSVPYNGIYNYYNIGAYTGAGDGLRWANAYMKAKVDTPVYSAANTTSNKLATVPKGTELNFMEFSGDFYKVSAVVSGKTYKGFIPKVNVSASTNYGRPWDSPYKSIYFGAQYIYASFSEYQFTGYLQKFNVNPASDNLYSHEYMANIRAAAAESQKTYKAYNESGVLSTKKVFSIPVFRDMPDANLSAEESFKQAKPYMDECTATENSVTLNWSGVKDALYYQVWKFDTAAGHYKMIKATSAKTYTDTGFLNGATARYKIRAFRRDAKNEYIFSQYSDEFIARSAPAMPAGVSVVSANNNSIKIKWNAVACDGYDVYRYNNVSGYTLAGTVTATEFLDTSLVPGSKYMYKVCAFYKTESMTACSAQTPSLSVSTTGSAPLTGVVNVNGSLNIRTEANTSSSVLTTVQSGQAVLVLEKLAGWYKVQFTINDTAYTGYASADYIKLITVAESSVCPYAEPTATLRQGAKGDGVKWLQWHLFMAGYMTHSDIDGSFGAQTVLAVKSFQGDKGLTVDGVVGAGTRTELKKSI